MRIPKWIAFEREVMTVSERQYTITGNNVTHEGSGANSEEPYEGTVTVDELVTGEGP